MPGGVCFNSRPSCEGRHGERSGSEVDCVSIHAPRVRGDLWREPIGIDNLVSIHAPRVRGDKNFVKIREYADVSIHAPRVRGDVITPEPFVGLQFQFTPLV